MDTMALTFTNFDTLRFAKKLEEAGVEPKIAETQAELQAECQEKIFEAFAEYTPILDEIKITKHEFATKSDINSLRCEMIERFNKVDRRFGEMEGRLDKMEGRLDRMEGRLDRMEGKIDCLRNDLIFKLGGIMVGSVAILGTLFTLLFNHIH